MDRYASIEKSLESKCALSEITQLDMRIKQLEEKLGSLDNELESRLSSVEDHVKLNFMTAAAAEKENAIPDEELIKVVVQEELNRKTAEEKDLENRKRNIIIHRVPEKRSDSVVERRQSNLTFVKDLLDGVFDMKLGDEKMLKC